MTDPIGSRPSHPEGPKDYIRAFFLKACLFWLLLSICLAGLAMARKQALQHFECCTNKIAKDYAGAVEAYATDWHSYPFNPNLLVQERYLRTLPTCPSRKGPSYDYARTNKGFVLQCSGQCHWIAAWLRGRPSQPIYDSENGLDWK